jgi:hypothetical protein
MNTIKAKLVADWQWVLKRTWSVRFTVIAALLSGVEAMLPLFSERVPHRLFALLTFLAVAGAFIARFVAQSREK